MATPTITIRVSRATHDMLAQQARERGVSLSALLAEVADERRRQAAWVSEREASRIDADKAEVQAETFEWDATSEDGID